MKIIVNAGGRSYIHELNAKVAEAVQLLFSGQPHERAYYSGENAYVPVEGDGYYKPVEMVSAVTIIDPAQHEADKAAAEERHRKAREEREAANDATESARAA